ncbi:MAG: hypothetical protein JL55_34500 [Pseudomonas sp. BICA1-14]|nr:MAG: hypothetical protein JL55_34500 [[Pseudomonas] sp. BICA1-14]
MTAAVVAQMADHCIQPHHIHQQRIQRTLVGFAQVLGIEHPADGTAPIAQQQVHLRREGRRDAAGKQHGVYHAGADDTEQNLLGTRQGDIEDGRWVIDLGETDQRHRIGGE